MTTLEIRSAGDLQGNGRTVSGYAAVFASPADLGDFTEEIRAGAFTASLEARSNIRALYHHQGDALLGTTRAKTLRLAQDSRGLRFDLDLPDTTHGRDLAELVRRGDVSGASFGFRVRKGGEAWEQRSGKPYRLLTDLDLIEITLTHDPAYQDTAVALRSRPSVYETHGIRRLWLETCK